MSFQLRDGELDVAVIAGPGLAGFPTHGAAHLIRTLSRSGLKVGGFGGADVRCRGVIPRADTGALLLLEDAQLRIHRIKVASVVRFVPPLEVPDPFSGSDDPHLLLGSAARKYEREGVLHLGGRKVLLLGGANRTLSYGARLLSEGSTVVAVSPHGFDEAWQVERTRFTRRGGLLSVSRPESLTVLENGRLEIKCRDTIGTRLFEVDHAISIEPWPRPASWVREFPRESLLFEIESRALESVEADVLGWSDEEAAADLVAARICRVIAPRGRRPREQAQRTSTPTVLAYRGKWLESESLKKLRGFSGTPRSAQTRRLVASIECLDEIPCTACEAACPEKAINLGARGSALPVLKEELCTACGICVNVCPSEAPILIEEKATAGKIVFRHPANDIPPLGTLVSVVSRQGEVMGSARSLGSMSESLSAPGLMAVEVPTHLVWEVRGIKHKAMQPTQPEPKGRIEVSLDQRRRLVDPLLTVTSALASVGRARAVDRLECGDGSCRRCLIEIDGVKQLGCQTRVRAGMTIVTQQIKASPLESMGCACLGVTMDAMVGSLRAHPKRIVAAHARALRLGEGRCCGRMCVPVLRQKAAELGFDGAAQWIDWRFPSEEWVLTPGAEGPG